MHPHSYRFDHGYPTVIRHRERDLVDSRGGVGLENTDSRLNRSISELPLMGDYYSIGVIAGGAVEEYCFSGEDYCRCPSECWYGRHVVLDIDDPVGPDNSSRAVPDCQRDIVRAPTWKSVDGRVAGSVCAISEGPCECVGRCSPAGCGVQSNWVSRCRAGRAECEGCCGRLDCCSKDGASYQRSKFVSGARSATPRSDQSLASTQAGSRCGRFSEGRSALRRLLLAGQNHPLCTACFLDILGQMLQRPGEWCLQVRASSLSGR